MVVWRRIALIGLTAATLSCTRPEDIYSRCYDRYFATDEEKTMACCDALQKERCGDLPSGTASNDEIAYRQQRCIAYEKDLEASAVENYLIKTRPVFRAWHEEREEKRRQQEEEEQQRERLERLLRRHEQGRERGR